MEDFAHLPQFQPVLVGDVDVLELLHRDSLERVVGPLLEPVDGAAVDQRRELPQALAERLADG